ncbi:NineTeen Complex (NTC) component [Gonapodya sp. JEL0774]|nr:NineTeen Complex (NTC) component [Gonapodya sp. JEL0774]
MLYRFREAQQAELGLVKPNQKRPYLASLVDDLKEAERWRGQILSEIGKKVAKIQDSGLNDYQVRDLNDEINKLIREKSHWENRIIELGGPNYKRSGGRTYDADGKEVPGSRGYRYFGRAKHLPGVRELFESAVSSDGPVPRTRYELSRNIDADYYGYRDEDDGELLAYEDRVARRFGKMAKKRKVDGSPSADSATVPTPYDELDDIMLEVSGSYNGIPAAVAVAAVDSVPSQKEVEEYLVERRRKELLQRFLGSEASIVGSEAAREADASAEGLQDANQTQDTQDTHMSESAATDVDAATSADPGTAAEKSVEEADSSKAKAKKGGRAKGKK